MSATRPIKIIGPLTRVMKRNNGNSKVNIIFSLFPEKEPTCRFCPFAAHRLWNAVKETASGITAWQYFFFPSGHNALMSSKCPPREALMYRGLFCWGVWGSDQRNPADYDLTVLTLDVSDWCQMWPWNSTGVVVHLILLATMSGCLFFVVKRSAVLESL